MPTFWKIGDSLAGERVASSFRKINPQIILSNGFFDRRCCQTKLEGNVYCVLEKPLTTAIEFKRSNIYLDIGDAIKAEKIITQFGSHRRIKITRGSSSHRIQNCIFEDKVFCVIDLPMIKVSN